MGGHRTEARAGANGLVSELKHGGSARVDAKRR